MLKEHADVDNPQKEWGSYVLYRDSDRMARKLRGKLERKRTWKRTEGGRGIVALSFSTDCYQDARTADATRACVRELIDAGKHVRILTRNPILALQDLDLYEEGAQRGLVTVGSSIPCMDADQVAAIERRAPHPEARLKGLEGFAYAGVPVYVSMSPTYPMMGPGEIGALLDTFAERLDTLDVVFHEAINPRGGNFEMTVEAAREAGEDRLADELYKLRERHHWRRYAVRQLRMVKDMAWERDIPVKLWPGKDLVTACKGTPDEQWVRAEWIAPSPESFASGN